jgi:hypothetical protein
LTELIKYHAVKTWSYSCTVLNLGISFTPLPLYSGETTYGTHFIGGCVGPRVGPVVTEKR